MNLLAIDPGESGGLAWTDSNGTQCLAMPPTDGDILDLLRSIKASGVDRCVIEQVGGFTGEGQPGSRMFNFGESYGFVKGCLMALGFRMELVTPQRWQKELCMAKEPKQKFSKAMTAEQRKAAKSFNAKIKTRWKNRLKERAQQLYPEQTVTLKTADSLLILDYAKNLSKK
jgi:hypothetical protein